MRVRVRLFAVLREAAGIGDLQLDFPADFTARQAAIRLAERYPAISRHLARVAYAVNQNYAAADSPLRDGDELALIPPVSGG